MRLFRPFVGIALAISLLGCGERESPVSSGNPAFDPAAPTVIMGKFLNAAGLPAIGANVELQVWDDWPSHRPRTSRSSSQDKAAAGFGDGGNRPVIAS